MEKIMTTQLVWNGCDMDVVADERNSEIPAWPVQDEGGRWHYEQFKGQRVVFSGAHVHFGFLAVEVDKAEVPTDEDGEMILDGLTMTNDGRVFRPE